MTVNDQYIFKFFYIIHSFLTYGYMSETILALFVLVELFLLIAMLKSYKLFIFLLNDRIRFGKRYLYFSFIQKRSFIRSFFYISKPMLKKYGYIALIFLVVGIIVFYIVFTYLFGITL